MTPLEFIKSQVDCDRTTSIADLGLDSLELLQLEMDCEKQFGKKIPDERYAVIQTVGDLADALQ